jgi:hypothetical protein
MVKTKKDRPPPMGGLSFFAVPHNLLRLALQVIGTGRWGFGGKTVCVTCVWAGVDSAWEQEKPEARKMLL